MASTRRVHVIAWRRRRCSPPWPPPHRSVRTRSTSDRGARPSWRWASTARRPMAVRSSRSTGSSSTSPRPARARSAARRTRTTSGSPRRVVDRAPWSAAGPSAGTGQLDRRRLLPDAVAGQAPVLRQRADGPGACGAGDIYRTRRHPVRGWLTPDEPRLRRDRHRPELRRWRVQPVRRRDRRPDGPVLLEHRLRRPRPGHLRLVEAGRRDLRPRRARSTS